MASTVYSGASYKTPHRCAFYRFIEGVLYEVRVQNNFFQFFNIKHNDFYLISLKVFIWEGLIIIPVSY